MRDPRHNHELTHEERVRGGKNQKRGPSIKKRLEKFLQAPIPPNILKALKEKKLFVDGKAIPVPVIPFAKNMADAVALLTLKAALDEQPWAVKLITEQIDGAAKTSGSLDVKGLSLADVLANDTIAKAVLEKYTLNKREQKKSEPS